MKKSIIKRLGFILTFAIIFSLVVNYLVQFENLLQTELKNTKQTFWEMQQILAANEEESALVEEDFKQICLVRAKAAAYLVQYHPEMLTDQAEMKKVANFLLIDEFHVFNEEGTIYAGMQPQYFGMNFNDGEQMRFFLPMLEDKSLSLCQDITPNTAEAKLMQYAAVWCEDGKNIVQVGLKPERVIKAQNKTDLSYIFSMITSEPETDIYAIDAASHEILASTRSGLAGQNALELGFEEETFSDEDAISFQEINGRDSLCVFEKNNKLVLASVRESSTLFQSLFRSTILLALYVILMAGIATFFIIRYLNQNIVHGIYDINDKMTEIENGNLVLKLPPQSTPEMTELTTHINDMVTSLINQQTKMALILETVKLPIGTFEYNTSTKQLSITSRTLDILGFAKEHLHSDIDPALFRDRMDLILSAPVNRDKNIFLVPGEEQRFVHVEYFKNEENILGIIMDVTEDFQEKQLIEHERDVDLLTNLLSRRAFYHHVEELFQNPEELKSAAFVMIDSDNLKFVNDTYGHANGDRYLQAISGILDNFPGRKLAARLSGDEFILFLYGYDSREELEAQINLLYQQRQHSFLTLKDCCISVEFSAGFAFYPEDGTEYGQLMKIADKKMYTDKKTRKGVL